MARIKIEPGFIRGYCKFLEKRQKGRWLVECLSCGKKREIHKTTALAGPSCVKCFQKRIGGRSWGTI